MKIFMRYFLLGNIGITLSSYAMVTFVNNSHWSPLRMQIAIDADEHRAQVPGNTQDIPLHEHAAIEINDLTILPENKFTIRTFPNQLLHLRLATYGNARNSQIMVTIINEVEIQVNDMGKGDIVVERDLGIVNNTNKIVYVKVDCNGLKRDYGNSRQLWQDHSTFTGLPWTREMVSKTFELLPEGAIAPREQLNNDRKVKYSNLKLPLMSFTSSRGLLTIQCQKKWVHDAKWLFDLLLPLTGLSNRLEIRDKPIKKILALTCALHPHLGAHSPANMLTPDILKKIYKILPGEPYFLTSIQTCTKTCLF